MSHRLIPNVVVMALAVCSVAANALAQTANYSYVELMQLPPAQRQPVFRSLTPPERASILRQHLENWLNVHRPDLSATQIDAVTEAIAFVTPELYRVPPDPVMRERQSAIAERLACSLSDDLSGTLMDFAHEPKRVDRTWRQTAHNWIDWLVNCVVPWSELRNN